MAASKLVALIFVVAIAAVVTQPSEARPQQLKFDVFADQDGQEAPQPATCLTSLIGMMSCVDYLTNFTVQTPLSSCCDGFKSVINDAPICLCHAINGDLNRLVAKPINPIRMITLPLLCRTWLPLRTIFSCNSQTVPPIMPPASPVVAPPVAPAPSPSDLSLF